jgi:phosphatidylglycerophosphatase C
VLKQSCDVILERIERVRRARPFGVVAFDGDGTLWGGDVGEDFFHAMVARGRFEPAACEEMRRCLLEFQLPDEGVGAVLAKRLWEAYLAGCFPEERICEVMAWGFAGWTDEEVRAFAGGVARDGALESRLHAEVVRVLSWVRDAGLEAFVVSASPRAIVEEAARCVKVDGEHVVAATPRYDGHTMRAEVERPIPYGPGKVTGLRACVGGRPLYAAFGDNLFDIPLLSAAEVAVAVRPKPRLLACADDVAGLVEIEPEPR